MFAKKFLIAITVSVFSISNAFASIIFDNSVPGKITVSWDDTFVMSRDSSNVMNQQYLFLVGSGLFNTDDGSNWAFNSMNQTVSVNGGSPAVVGNWDGWQYRGGPEFNYDDHDLLLGLFTNTLPSFNVGDSLTWAGTMTLTETAVDRMPDVLSGNINAYLANYAGYASDIITTDVSTTNSTTVPEPATIALLGLGLVGLGLLRRRAR